MVLYIVHHQNETRGNILFAVGADLKYRDNEQCHCHQNQTAEYDTRCRQQFRRTVPLTSDFGGMRLLFDVKDKGTNDVDDRCRQDTAQNGKSLGEFETRGTAQSHGG